MVSLLLRVIFLLQIADAPFFDVAIIDAQGYVDWAKEISGGDWLGDKIFYQAPLYPYFIAVIFSLFGSRLIAVRLVQIVLGSVACCFVALAGMSFFSRKTGFVAGLLMAIYPVAIFFDGLIQKASLAMFLLAALLYLLTRVRDKREKNWFLLIGFVLGLLSLTRENSILFIPVIALWIFSEFRSRRLATRFLSLVLFLSGISVVLLPVGVRNLIVGGEFHITTSQFGTNLYIGNNEGANGTYSPLKPNRSHPEFERLDALDIAREEEKRELTPGEVSRFWAKKALVFISSHPDRWLRLTARKLLLTWNRVEMADGENIETYAEESALLSLLFRFFHFGVLTPLATTGLVLTWKRRRDLWLLYAFLLTITMSVVLFYVFARYRYPLVPFLILFAADGSIGIFAALKARRYRTALRVAPFVAAAAVLVNWPVVSEAHQRSFPRSMWWNVGNVYGNSGRYVEAGFCFRKALRYDPNNPELMYLIGSTARRSGRQAEAERYLTRVLEIQPEHIDARIELANVLSQQGRYADVLKHYKILLSIDPLCSKAYQGMGDCYVVYKKHDEAIDMYRKAIELDADNADASFNLGVLYFQKGLFAEALKSFQNAARVDTANTDIINNLGLTFEKMGQIDRAIVQYRRVLAREPDHAQAVRNLRRALGRGGNNRQPKENR